ncbi:hypothetical protein N9204_00405 [bacterium]|nr:hypothetical protein [bacterium]
MANEITVSAYLKVDDGTYSRATSTGNAQFDLTTSDVVAAGEIQTIGTTYEEITVGDVTTPGWSFFKNLDATNYVEIGIEHSGTTFVAFAKLEPGEFFPVPLAGGSIYAKADTASVRIQKLIYQR